MLGWVVAFIIAVVVFLVAEWLLGIVATFLPPPFSPPHALIVLVALVLAIGAFFYAPRAMPPA